MSKSQSPIIEVIDVHRNFQIGDIDVLALQGVNLKINKGEFVVILGASGSGKTTLLNQIGGIDTPTQGIVKVNNLDISNFNEKELTSHRRDSIGWIFQFHNLIPSLTATENVQLALELMGEKQNQLKRSQEALLSVGLETEFDRFPAQLSGGQQQRVAIARALVKKPEIIVADEPTGNLDSKTGSIIVELMHKLCKSEGITFVIVTHDRKLTDKADQVFEMEDGVILKTK